MRAWTKFQAICEAQGGMRVPPVAEQTHPLAAARDGRVVHIDNRKLARLAKLALAQAFTEDEILPEARVAMVWGRILSRLGDIYGPTVNLAARLTTLADPGTVLVDSMTASALEHDERFVMLPQPPENVRGFGEIRPVQLTRGLGKGLVLD